MFCTWLAENTGCKKSPSGHHRTTLSGYIFATKARIDNWEKIVKQQYLLHVSHNMVNFGPLAADVGPVVRGTPTNFNGFRVLALLLQRRRSPEANHTLHDVWPLPGLVDYIIHFRRLLPVTEFCQVQNSMCVLQVLRSPIGIAAARHSSIGHQSIFAALNRGRHLCSAGGHHVGHWPTFLAYYIFLWFFFLVLILFFQC